ncbi:MAG TPA: cadherin-like beta sandwich domain-containing protein [Opitutus sp.]|nr:cadherin-like beta sandwich domain-containing protein [Opitutus sp.]
MAVAFVAISSLLQTLQGATPPSSPALRSLATPQRVSGNEVPKGLTALEWTSIRAAHEAARRAIVAVPGGHAARSPAQQWRTFFDARGAVTTPDGGAWHWGLELKRYGFSGHEIAVSGEPAVQVAGERLTYVRDANVQEWFVNEARGLEHGFTVAERPVGAEAGRPLVLEMDVRGDLFPVAEANGQGVRFLDTRGGPVVTYAGLEVRDAAGRRLEARLSAQGGVVRLSIDERDARYPLTIDPIAQQAYLKASNTGGSDFFGQSVAIAGDTVVVGAPGEASGATGVDGNQSDNSANASGAAYVFVRNGTTWSQQAYLKASNTGANDNFGLSVAIADDTLVVGAAFESSGAVGVNGDQSDNSASWAGAAYVFVRSGTTWSQQAYLKASNTDRGDNFGLSVAIADDTVVVGAAFESSSAVGVNGDQSDNSARWAGAAYVFVRSGTTWSQQAYLKASNTESDLFGSSVAIADDTVIVGAVWESSSSVGVNGNQSDNSAGQSGAAYVFVRSGTTWSQQAYLKASNTHSLDQFGTSVAIAGDTAVVGALDEASSATGVDGDQTDHSAASSGAAYVFVRSGTTWSQQAYLKASNADAYDKFGSSVAIADDTVVVGAPFEGGAATGVNGNGSDNSAGASGAAYVFVRSGTTWSQQAYLKASNTGRNDFFGSSVAVAGNTALVGAFGEASSATGVDGNQSDNSASASGAAYVFTLSVPPVVSSVSPASGPLAGGTTVTITGSGFTGATAVTFGATDASDFTVDSDTQITVTAPAGTLGAVDVTVTTAGGTSATSAADKYTYVGSNNANLSNLTISAGTLSPAFAASKQTYAVALPPGTTSVTVTPTVADSHATVTVNGVAVTSGAASGAISFGAGHTSISVMVTASNTTTSKLYLITLRAAPVVGSPTATGVTATTATLGGTVSFDGNQTITSRGIVYALTADNADPRNKNRTVSTVLVDGTTGTFTTALTGLAPASGYSYAAFATNGQGTTYSNVGTFTTSPASTDAKLRKLVLSSGTLSPAFASATLTYTATVPNGTTSVTVTPTASSSVAKVRVAGTAVTSGTASAPIALAVGANAIKIRVVAEDGVTIVNYTVTVTRAP